jgi:hypothetical protein
MLGLSVDGHRIEQNSKSEYFLLHVTVNMLHILLLLLLLPNNNNVLLYKNEIKSMPTSPTV